MAEVGASLMEAATVRMAEPADQRKPLPKPKQVKDRDILDVMRSRLMKLRNERSPFLGEWREIHDNVQPRRGRYLTDARNQHNNRTSRIINNTPRLASRTLAAGMMGGISSPARNWYRLTTNTPQLAELSEVKNWLTHAGRILNLVFAKSNFYNSLHTMYGDLGDIGNASMIMDEDAEDVLRCTVLAPGEYMWALSERGHVNTVYREFTLTAEQLIERFGYENVSSKVTDAYDRAQYDAEFKVCHVIEPNRDHVPNVRGGQAAFPYVCAYFEVNHEKAQKAGDQFLQLKGYNEWPAPSPRWDLMSGDTYGVGPGLDALGDARALQILERRKAQAIDKGVTPPLAMPPSIRNSPVSHLPGGVTFVPNAELQSAQGRELYRQNPQLLSPLSTEIQRHEYRINGAYYKDLFLMLAQSDRREITAREVEERHEEKLLALGPVMERLHNELLNYSVTRAFSICQRGGYFPAAPRQLMDAELKIDYVSILAQAQKAIDISSLERISMFVGNLMKADPGSLDKLDTDQLIDEYGDRLGVPPGVIRSDDDVDKIRKKKNEKMAQMEQMAMAQQGADVAATAASAVPPQGAEDLMGQIMQGGLPGGAASP